jgi:uncharacterized UPF0146 family protein
MAQVAFKAADEDLSGATVSVGDGETFDIAAALKKGNGQIVLDLNKEGDRRIADAIENHPAVVSAPVASKKEGK